MKKESISKKIRWWVEKSKTKDASPLAVGYVDIGISNKYKPNMSVLASFKSNERELFSYIADEIDKEQKAIIECQRDSTGCYSPRYIMKTYAGNKGMPMKDGETITKWLDRYFIKRPCLTTGEIIKTGRWYTGKSDGKQWFVVGFSDGNYDVIAKDEHSVFKPLKSKWLRSETPKFYYPNGVEIQVNDKVWDKETGEEYRVAALPHSNECTSIKVVSFKHRGMISIDPNLLTNREADSQERINEDEKLNANAYCTKYNLTPHLDTEGRQTKYKHLFNRQRALTKRSV